MVERGTSPFNAASAGTAVTPSHRFVFALLMPLHLYVDFQRQRQPCDLAIYLFLPAVLTLCVGFKGKSNARIGALSGSLRLQWRPSFP